MPQNRAPLALADCSLASLRSAPTGTSVATGDGVFVKISDDIWKHSDDVTRLFPKHWAHSSKRLLKMLL